MNRRDFMLISASVTVALPIAAQPTRARAGTPYSADLVESALAEGRVVLLDFKASWCPSCQAQGRSIDALRAANPAYDTAITFVDVDWDTYKNSEVAKQFGVRNRGSLVLLRGDKVIAQTSTHSTKDALKEMLDKAATGA